MDSYKAYENPVRQIVYGALWFFFLASLAWNYATNGEANLWSIPILLGGLALFLSAKLSVVKKGHQFTFGASAADVMTTQMKWSYYGGYLIMIVGFLLAFHRF